MIITKFVGGPCHGQAVPAHVIREGRGDIATIAPHLIEWANSSPLMSSIETLIYRKIKCLVLGERTVCWAYDGMSDEELLSRITDMIFTPQTPQEPGAEEIWRNIEEASERLSHMVDQVADRELNDLAYRARNGDWEARERLGPFYDPQYIPGRFVPPSRSSADGWTNPMQREQYEQIEEYLLDCDDISQDAVRYRPSKRSQ